jgi:hypothetical protein
MTDRTHVNTKTMAELVGPVLDRLARVKAKKSDSWQALCPCHDDKNPSLDINFVQDKGGMLLIHCHACGANGRAVMDALKLPVYQLYARPTRRSSSRSSRSDEDFLFIEAFLGLVRSRNIVNESDLERLRRIFRRDAGWP